MIARDFTAFDTPVQSVEISKAVYASDDSSGGDRADVLYGPDGRLHLIVLDVCGHGRSAVEAADTIFHTVRTLLWQGLNPARVFTSLNEFLLDLYRDREEYFGTGAIASFDAEHSLITFSSAGHVDAFSFSDDGKTHAHHFPTGPLYGVLPDAEYENKLFPYSAGEAFVMVTDGLLEIKSTAAAISPLGTGGLCRIVRDMIGSPAGLSASRLISNVRHLAGGAFDDDVAAIVAA